MSFHPGVEKMQFQFADCTQPADCSEQPVGMQEVTLSISVLALQLFQYRYFHRRNLVFGPVVQLFEDNDPVLPFF